MKRFGSLIALSTPLAIFVLILPFDHSAGQRLEKLSDAIPQLRSALTMNFSRDQVDFLNALSFGFTPQGIVAISKDRSSLVCYRPDGGIAWTRQVPEKVVTAIHISDSGNIISAYYPLSEDGGVTEVIGEDGRVLWRKAFRAAFRVSPNGKYLYSGPSALSGMPLTVIETKTGRILWQENASDFRAELLDENRIIHISWGKIKLYQMSTGNLLGEKDIGEHFKDELHHTVWELSVSDDGKYFTVLGTSGKSLNSLCQTYDADFNLKWSRMLEPPAVQLVGLSEDGRRLLLSQGYKISLYDNSSGKLLWQIQERILNNGAVVTNRFIAMRQVGYESEVFVLGKDGSLMNRSKTHSIFAQTNMPKFETKKGAVSLKSIEKGWGAIVEIKKDNALDSVIFYTS